MKPSHIAVAMLLMMGTGVAAGRALSGRSEQAAANTGAAASQTSAAAFPKDVYPETGNRLPAIKRDSMDDAGKKQFDIHAQADFFGPGAIRLYSPTVAEDMGAVNDFLRNKSGLDQQTVQLVILVTAREFDSEYVWTAHEPQAL